MTEQELQQLVERISIASFHLPFMNRAVFNGRLKTTGGRFMLADQHLDFNPHLFAVMTPSQQAGVIKHELCHYHLYRAKRGYQHRDQDFKRLLAQVGGLRYAPALKAATARYEYICARCGQRYFRQRRINTRRYRCGRCGGPLRLTGQRDDFRQIG